MLRPLVPDTVHADLYIKTRSYRPRHIATEEFRLEFNSGEQRREEVFPCETRQSFLSYASRPSRRG